MAELWCHKSVSPAPGKDVKEEWGPGGQGGLEWSLKPQQENPGHSHANRALLPLVCCPIPRNQQWLDTWGTTGTATKS